MYPTLLSMESHINSLCNCCNMCIAENVYTEYYTEATTLQTEFI